VGEDLIEGDPRVAVSLTGLSSSRRRGPSAATGPPSDLRRGRLGRVGRRGGRGLRRAPPRGGSQGRGLPPLPGGAVQVIGRGGFSH